MSLQVMRKVGKVFFGDISKFDLMRSSIQGVVQKNNRIQNAQKIDKSSRWNCHGLRDVFKCWSLFTRTVTLQRKASNIQEFACSNV